MTIRDVLQAVLFTSVLAFCWTDAVSKTQEEEVNEDASLPTTGLISKYGYPAETHHVTTADGYVLELHRIPYGVKSPAAADKPVVFLQHGLVCSSADWVLMGPEKGLAYILADLGYDVWMGNSRGNTYSRKHVTLDPNQPAFWNFSWHEMGWYDLPAAIDYVLNVTGNSKLFYVGHSQGTTQFYVMASERPEYNAKIRAMISLAPIAYMNHAQSLLMHLLAPAIGSVGLATSMVGESEFLPSNELFKYMGETLCKDQAPSQEMCVNMVFLICGFDSEQMNKTMIPVISGHSPAGASTKQFLHYSQEVNSGGFEVFGTFFPRQYDLSKITCPVALHYGDNDLLSSPTDVDRLYKKIRNPIGKFLVPFKKFNHLDFLWAIDVKKLLYNKIISQMANF